tara:strand:+ start:1039 stop:1914 length:876 start_codon:yes stop_codon:yes gene_type:complete
MNYYIFVLDDDDNMYLLKSNCEINELKKNYYIGEINQVNEGLFLKIMDKSYCVLIDELSRYEKRNIGSEILYNKRKIKTNNALDKFCSEVTVYKWGDISYETILLGLTKLISQHIPSNYYVRVDYFKLDDLNRDYENCYGSIEFIVTLIRYDIKVTCKFDIKTEQRLEGCDSFVYISESFYNVDNDDNKAFYKNGRCVDYGKLQKMIVKMTDGSYYWGDIVISDNDEFSYYDETLLDEEYKKSILDEQLLIKGEADKEKDEEGETNTLDNIWDTINKIDEIIIEHFENNYD